VRVTGPAGTLVLFTGLAWHAGQANNTNPSRTPILGCYTNKFVRPLEDWHRGLSEATKAQCQGRLRDLLMLDYPYPAVMDELEGRSSEGTLSKLKVKRAYT
jgi:ectoine hydroxylase-related dioxygenase (phytanoyl-CoA dioxygenase family)